MNDTRVESQSMEEERRRSRLSQYLDFVKLYTDLYKNKEAKKEANVIWKEKIQRENYEEMSSVDYLEQLAILKRTSGCSELEFSCAGAETSVEIAGTFNNWTPQPLKFSRVDGGWNTTIQLRPGVYQYKYIVDGVWLHDPKHEFEDDGKGNINNVMRVEDKITMKMDEINQELKALKPFLEEPWKVDVRKQNDFCIFCDCDFDTIYKPGEILNP